MTIENAKIISTELGIEDHGIFTFHIFIDGKGWGTGFGGIVLDDWNKTVYLIRTMLNVVGVSKWEDLKGKLIRVEFLGLGSKTKRIGNIIEDKWVDLDDWTNK